MTAKKREKKEPKRERNRVEALLFGRPMSSAQRLAFGLAVMVLGLILLVSVISFYFTWSDDQAVLRSGITWGEISHVSNSVGKIGAWFGNLFVGRWFGVFGIGIPIMLLVFAARLFMDRRMLFGKSIRITFLTMILGSVTLGCLFSTSWSVFGTGLGGELGIVATDWIESYVGKIGLLLILLFLWILLAIYINRNTVAVLNRMGDVVAGKATTVWGRSRERAAMRKAKRQSEDSLAEGFEEQAQHQNIRSKSDEDEWTMETEDRARSEDSYNYREEQRASRGYREANSRDEWQEAKERYAEGGARAEYKEVRRQKADNDEWEMTTENVYVDESATIAHTGNVAAIELEDDDFMVLDTSGNRVPASEVSGVKANQAGTRPSQTAPVTLGAGGVVITSDEDGMQVVRAESHEEEVDEDDINAKLYDPTLELRRYKCPPVDLLVDHSTGIQISSDEIAENKAIIKEKLSDFGLAINDKIKATIGPTVTLYEIEPAQGVKISRIRNLEEDIALALKVQNIRIVTLGAGRGTVGIEVPNSKREVVSMQAIVKSQKFQDCQYKLPVALGKTIYNEIFIGDLTKMPHLLVAGATGQGKSVGLNAIITSLLYKKHPSQLKFVLVDPKQVELSVYAKLEKHFLAKMESEETAILTDTQKVVYTLNSLVSLMEQRYTLLNKAGERNINDYNAKFTNRRLNPEKGHHFMPYIVVVIDEFADMIMTAGREVEIPITRLAAKARAIGIHLIVATQRPDVKVITGLIKSNIPARIAFKVVSMVDSRTILDQPGANNLIGMGDMLLSVNGELTRIQCAFVDTPEIERITNFIGEQKGYSEPYKLPDYVPEDGGGAITTKKDVGKLDDMFEEVARFVVLNNSGSTSAIQRHFEIGYNRAGRLMDQLEASGIVGRAQGSKPREVLIYNQDELERIFAEIGI